jgi:hypothetical protein
LAAGAQSRGVDQNALKNAGKTGEDWLTYGLNYCDSDRQRAIDSR